MRDDEADDHGGRHDVATIPPPPGESDIYDAKTQVGGLPPEAMALLRQLRDEPRDPARSLEEANVPVFVEDSGASSEPAPKPAAGRPAAPMRPAAGAPAAPPKARAPEPSVPEYSVAPRPDAHERPASAPAKLVAASPDLLPLALPLPPPSAPAEQAPVYSSVFAPLPADVAAAVAPAPPVAQVAPAPSRIWMVGVLGVLVLLTLVVVVLGQAGIIPGLAPLGHAPSSAPIPSAIPAQ